MKSKNNKPAKNTYFAYFAGLFIEIISFFYKNHYTLLLKYYVLFTYLQISLSRQTFIPEAPAGSSLYFLYNSAKPCLTFLKNSRSGAFMSP